MERKQDSELDELRRKYDDLCTRLVAGSGGDDPAAEGAIIEELQRLSDRIVALIQKASAGDRTRRAEHGAVKPYGDRADSDRAGKGETDEDETERGQADSDRTAASFERVLALLERQGRQVEHILRRSDEHREQLERMERRLVETMPLIERQLPELRAAADHQRQRITALAVAVQRLIQLLAAQHGPRS